MLQKAALEFDQGHSNQFNDSRFSIRDYSRLDRGKNQKENVFYGKQVSPRYKFSPNHLF